MATCEFVTSVMTGNYGGNVASKTYSSVDLGAADTNRYIIIVGQFGSNDGSDSLSSASIGGVAATMGASNGYGGSGEDGFQRIFWAKVPTGTTGDVVLNFTSDAIDGMIGVYRVVANEISVFDTDSQAETTNDPVNMSVDVEAGGFIIGSLNMKDSTSPGGTWSIDGNASTNYQTLVGNGSATFGSAGLRNFASGASAVSVSCDRSDTTNNMAAFAVAFSAVTTQAYSMVAGQGSFALTGQDVSFLKAHGYTLVAEFGSYVLTGIAVNFVKALSIVIGQGSYVLTGQAITINRGYRMVLEAGSYVLTGFQARFPLIYNALAKAATVFSPQSKNSTVYTDQDQSSAG